MSGKRKKTEEEKEWDKTHESSNVVCKLSRLCKDPMLLAEIRRTCLVLKQIQLEAWHIANFHVLRCLTDELDFPILDQTFFNRCCQAARVNGIRESASNISVNEVDAEDRKRGAKRSVDEDLRETVRRYRAEREAVQGYVAPLQLEYDGNVMLAIAAQMRVNAHNMIVLHFEKRLSMYVRIKLEEGTTEKAPVFAVNRLVRACYRSAEGDFAEDELQLRRWLGFMPYEDFIKGNMELVIKKLYEIQQTVENSQIRDPNKKGIRAFSLLPYSSSYTPAHIVINGSTLQGFCARVFKITGGHNPLNIPLTKEGVLIDKEKVCKQKELFLRRGFAVSQFETMSSNSTISKKIFNEMDHESKKPFARRLFDNQITTDGYSASVLLSRPKTDLELKIEEIKSENAKKPRHENNSTLDLEWSLLPHDYEADMLVAIDPGMRALCTAVSEGGIPLSEEALNKKRRENKMSRLRRKKRRKKGESLTMSKKRQRQIRKHWKRSRNHGRHPHQVGNQHIHSISTREFRHLAGMNQQRYWIENLKKRKTDYSDAISRIPSFKIASFDSYLDRLKIFWKYISFLVEFCAKNAFLKWRFFVSWKKKKTLDALAKRLVPVASSRVLVGYGDWSRRDKITGHAPSHVKGFRNALKKRATVVPIDEFRTSIRCSCCHEPLEHAVLPTRVDNNEIVLTKTKNVLRCPSSACKATFWNRDVNAARNILSLLKNKLYGLERPSTFRRCVA